MANSINLELEAITKRLKAMGREYGVEIRRKNILKRAGKVVVTTMKGKAPEDTGDLKQSVNFLNFKNDKEAVYVGSKIDRKKEYDGKRPPANYAYLVEFGFVDKSGKRVEGTPFVKQTYDQTKNQVLSNLEKEIEKTQQRLERKYRA